MAQKLVQKLLIFWNNVFSYILKELEVSIAVVLRIPQTLTRNSSGSSYITIFYKAWHILHESVAIAIVEIALFQPFNGFTWFHIKMEQINTLKITMLYNFMYIK